MEISDPESLPDDIDTAIYAIMMIKNDLEVGCLLPTDLLNVRIACILLRKSRSLAPLAESGVPLMTSHD